MEEDEMDPADKDKENEDDDERGEENKTEANEKQNDECEEDQAQSPDVSSLEYIKATINDGKRFPRHIHSRPFLDPDTCQNRIRLR